MNPVRAWAVAAEAMITSEDKGSAGSCAEVRIMVIAKTVAALPVFLTAGAHHACSRSRTLERRCPNALAVEQWASQHKHPKCIFHVFKLRCRVMMEMMVAILRSSQSCHPSFCVDDKRPPTSWETVESGNHASEPHVRFLCLVEAAETAYVEESQPVLTGRRLSRSSRVKV